MSWCNEINMKVDGKNSTIWMQAGTWNISNIAVPFHQLSWNLYSPIFISWTMWLIIVSWYSLNYNSLFYINIPKDLNSRSYEKISSEFSWNEQLSFWEETYSRFFYISLTDTHLQGISLTEREYCLSSTDYNWTEFSSKETIVQHINNRNIFITRLTITTEWNKHPYTYLTHFCFVKDNSVYNLVLDNYNFSQADQILNSFKFY